MQRAIQVLKLAPPLAAHAYKARHGVHWPSGSHAHQQHNTNYDSDGSEYFGASWPVLVLSYLLKPQAYLYRGTSSLQLPPLQFDNLYILTDFEFVHPLLMPKACVKGALAMASNVAANDASRLQETVQEEG